MSKESVKYKIVLDTNCLNPSKNSDFNRLISSITEDTYHLIKDNKNVSLWIPQMVLDERISQILISIRDEYDNINSASKKIKSFGSFNIQDKVFKYKTYKAILDRQFEDIIAKYEIYNGLGKLDTNMVKFRWKN